MEGSSNSNAGCNGDSVFVTSNQNQMSLKSELQTLNVDLSHSSVNLVNEGCESPISSWDSEPETDIPSVINCDDMLDMEEQNQFVGVENTDDGLLWEMDNRSYEELLKKFLEKEEELRVSNFKLQLSEQEIIKLKVQAENSDGQLDNMSKELKQKEEELHKQKVLSEQEISELKFQIAQKEELNIQKELSEQEIFKLKIQIEKSENQLDDVREKLNLKEDELKIQKELSEEEIFKLKIQIEKSEKQLQVAHEMLRLSKDEIKIVRKELGSKSSETRQLQNQLKVAHEIMAESELELGSDKKLIQRLEGLVIRYENNKNEIYHKLKVERLKSEIASLSETKTLLTAKLVCYEHRNKELERQNEELQATQPMDLQFQIMSLREELGQRTDDREAMKKELDKVRNEIDKANVKIYHLNVEICSRDDKISNMKKYTEELKASLIKSMTEYNTKLNEVDKLKLRVGELKEEVTRQSYVILDMTKEKRKAIRQLHCSLEYYRSGYHELLQEFYD